MNNAVSNVTYFIDRTPTVIIRSREAGECTKAFTMLFEELTAQVARLQRSLSDLAGLLRNHAKVSLCERYQCNDKGRAQLTCEYLIPMDGIVPSPEFSLAFFRQLASVSLQIVNFLRTLILYEWIVCNA